MNKNWSLSSVKKLLTVTDSDQNGIRWIANPAVAKRGFFRMLIQFSSCMVLSPESARNGNSQNDSSDCYFQNVTA